MHNYVLDCGAQGGRGIKDISNYFSIKYVTGNL